MLFFCYCDFLICVCRTYILLVYLKTYTFFRFTQYNVDAHNTHTLTPMKTCTQTHPYEHRQIWRFSKSPLAPRRRRERRLPLNA
jgi:hypothetical protein